MEIYICFSIFRFIFGIDVKLFKKDVRSVYTRYFSSVEFLMEKQHRLKTAAPSLS